MRSAASRLAAGGEAEFKVQPERPIRAVSRKAARIRVVWGGFMGSSRLRSVRPASRQPPKHRRTPSDSSRRGLAPPADPQYLFSPNSGETHVDQTEIELEGQRYVWDGR